MDQAIYDSQGIKDDVHSTPKSKEVWAMLPRENFKTKTVSGIHVQESVM